MTASRTLAARSFVIPATVITVALTVALPFLVHLLPPVGAVPMGAVLLPLFIAPFIAAYLFHPTAALIASLVTPLLNRQLTGQPTVEMAVMLTVELCAFTVVALLLRSRWPRSVINAPLAYLAAKLVAAGVLGVTALIPALPLGYLTSSLINALPGLVLLLVVNVLVVRGLSSRS
ncbi:MAG: hypothetical protein KF813_07810 [Trueperaceae bacterium]|nr:hypothetical protein [Trueperaceae bacterium]